VFTVRMIRNPQAQHEKLLIVETGGAHGYHWALKELLFSFLEK
jgi:hypothetical protein